jgi:hypothetical protein
VLLEKVLERYDGSRCAEYKADDPLPFAEVKIDEDVGEARSPVPLVSSPEKHNRTSAVIFVRFVLSSIPINDLAAHAHLSRWRLFQLPVDRRRQGRE